jgi:hypothetical protein
MLHGIYAMGLDKLQIAHMEAVRRDLPATRAALETVMKRKRAEVQRLEQLRDMNVGHALNHPRA